MSRYLVGIFFVAAVWPQPVLRGAEPETDLRTLGKTSEIHCVLIGQPLASDFSRWDVKDWPKMVDALRLGNKPGERVWGLVPQEARVALENADTLERIKKQPRGEETFMLTFPVLQALRKTVEWLDFYDEDVFKGIALKKDVKDLIALGDKRTYVQTLRLNRELLAAAFPKLVSECPADYLAARVKVKAGQDVLLVLNCYGTCRWEVEVEKGGKVSGILLCGYHTQEVTGVDAPVVYRAYAGPKGKWLGNTDYITNARRKTDPRYDEIMGKIKNLTGKDPSDIQLQDKATKEPFIIKPNAK